MNRKEEMLRQTVIKAMSDRFMAVVSENAGKPFPETEVFLPSKSFEGYADAVVAALRASAAPEEGMVTQAELEEVITDQIGARETWDNESLARAIFNYLARHRVLPSDSGKASIAPTCTCGQAGHGNAHEPGCPLSSYAGPTKYPRQAVSDSGRALKSSPSPSVGTPAQTSGGNNAS